jgi:hypothetical protein
MMVEVGWLGLTLSIYHGKLVSGSHHGGSPTITTFKGNPLQFISSTLIATLVLTMFTGYATFLRSRVYKGENG